jgi:hypothetical protein
MHKDAPKTKWDDSVRMFGKQDLIAGGDPTGPKVFVTV